MTPTRLAPGSSLPRVRLFRWLMAIFAIAVIVVGGLTLYGLRNAGLAAVDAQLDAARPYFRVFRLSVLGLLIGTWPRWVPWVAQRSGLSEVPTQQALAPRWRVAAWLIGFDGLVVEGIGRDLLAAVLNGF